MPAACSLAGQYDELIPGLPTSLKIRALDYGLAEKKKFTCSTEGCQDDVTVREGNVAKSVILCMEGGQKNCKKD